MDKVAASGGYMMACVADRIIAAPFAIIGSIGVVAQVPNFNRLLKRNDIDVELHTAGEYKRTLTLFGENTEQGRNKFREDLNETHQLFKSFVQQMRPVLDIDRVATGEYWYGSGRWRTSLSTRWAPATILLSDAWSSLTSLTSATRAVKADGSLYTKRRRQRRAPAVKAVAARRQTAAVKLMCPARPGTISPVVFF